MLRRFFAVVTLLFLSNSNVIGQKIPVSKKVRTFYEKAQLAWQQRQFPEAAINFSKVLEIEPDHYEANLIMARISELQHDLPETKRYYQKVIALKPDSSQSAGAYLWLGKSSFYVEDYDQALPHFEKSLALFPKKSSLRLISGKLAEASRFAINAVKHPLEINKKSLGDTVNQFLSQYFPVLTADKETLIFTGQTETKDENIYYSNFRDNVWTIPESISTQINSIDNEGTCSISADGRTLVYTACNKPDGYGSCDLYISHKTGTEWADPINLGDVVNSRNWDSQPSLSADGSTLYFSSDRNKGLGKKDIYKTTRKPNNEWSEPMNLGHTINTSDDDVAPFIHANGKVLFYSTDGKPGMGGFDVFTSHLIDTSWSEPFNLGYPINRVTDQVGLFIASDGLNAYYTDENTDGKSRIYSFLMPKTLRDLIVPARYAKGTIFDKVSDKPVSARIEVFDLQTQTRVGEYVSDSQNGKFLAVLNQGADYALYVSNPSYLFKSLTFSIQDSLSAINLKIPLESIEKDHIEVLRNIFFKTNSFELDSKSKVELHKLSDFLKNNSAIQIEVSGHTDDIGTDQANQELSKRRAETVVLFLIDQGISKERVSAKGYGKTQPLAPNNSEENRQKNRRIEWRIR